MSENLLRRISKIFGRVSPERAEHTVPLSGGGMFTLTPLSDKGVDHRARLTISASEGAEGRRGKTSSPAELILVGYYYTKDELPVYWTLASPCCKDRTITQCYEPASDSVYHVCEKCKKDLPPDWPGIKEKGITHDRLEDIFLEYHTARVEDLLTAHLNAEVWLSAWDELCLRRKKTLAA